MFSRRLRDAVFTAAEIGIAVVFMAWIFRETYIAVSTIFGLKGHWLHDVAYVVVRGISRLN
jgi:hypothetical protein